MSEENVKIVRRSYEHYNRTGEPDFNDLDAEIVWDISRRTFDPGVYHGHEGLRELLARNAVQWRTMRIEPKDFVAAADQVVVSVRLVGVGKKSGAETTANAAHVWTFRDRRIIRHEAFGTMDQALKAAGLGE